MLIEWDAIERESAEQAPTQASASPPPSDADADSRFAWLMGGA
jgi:hypothetical protein